MTTQPLKRIPYALADYRRLRKDNVYYVDKTRFIPLIDLLMLRNTVVRRVHRLRNMSL